MMHGTTNIKNLMDHVSDLMFRMYILSSWTFFLFLYYVMACQLMNSMKFFFIYIHGSVHRNSILIRSNKIQQYAGIYLLQNHSTCFGCPLHPSSGVHKTVTAASGTGHSIWANSLPPTWPIGHGGRLLLIYYDLYERLQLQFDVLLMMGAMDIRNT